LTLLIFVVNVLLLVLDLAVGKVILTIVMASDVQVRIIHVLQEATLIIKGLQGVAAYLIDASSRDHRVSASFRLLWDQLLVLLHDSLGELPARDASSHRLCVHIVDRLARLLVRRLLLTRLQAFRERVLVYIVLVVEIGHGKA